LHSSTLEASHVHENLPSSPANSHSGGQASLILEVYETEGVFSVAQQCM